MNKEINLRCDIKVDEKIKFIDQKGFFLRFFLLNFENQSETKNSVYFFFEIHKDFMKL